MKVNEFMKWNIRVSAVYAIGIWGMIGSFGFFQLRKKWRGEASSPETDKEVIMDTPPPDPKPAEEKRGSYVDHIIVYRENFVPYSTRIYNFVKPFFQEASDTTAGSDTSEK
ncbi:hypothetical protein FKM82_018276 [Ascaphus truei]